MSLKQIKKRLQEFTFVKNFRKGFTKDKENCVIIVKAKFDDECKNGHNTFSLTADIYKNEMLDSCGCLHDEIEKHFPELKKYIKWHLVSSEGPLYYIENTMYYAKEEKRGIPNSWKEVLKFKGFPITFDFDKKFLTFLKEANRDYDFEVIPYSHKDNDVFSDNFTFGGFGDNWYDCPFHTEEEALEFLEALKVSGGIEIVKRVTGVTEGKKPDLKVARNCAIWPEATLEQLRDEKALKKRLPKLMAEFENNMNQLNKLENEK